METTVRISQLVLIAYCSFISGAMPSVIGTSLPDLRCLFNVQLDAVASLFLALGLTAGVSALLAVFFIRKVNVYILMTSLMLVYTGGTAVVAVTEHIHVAWIGLLASGFATGAVISCCMVMCNAFFKTESYAFHILSSSVSIGALLGPIIAEPFLGHKIEDVEYLLANITVPERPLREDVLNSSTSDDSSYCDETTSMTNVLYVVMAFLGLPAVIGSGVSYFKVKLDVRGENAPYTDLYHLEPVEKFYRTAFIALIVISLPMPFGLAFAYGSYITTLGVEGTLQLGIERSAVITSVFWLTFFIGRLISTTLSFFIRQQTILYVCLIGQIASSGFLIWASMTGEEELWIGTLSLAVFSGPNFAGLIAWSREYVSLTPNILCVFNFMDNVGASVLPFFCGVLINAYGQGAYLYFILALCVFEMVLFLIAHYFGTKIHVVHDNGYEMMDILPESEKRCETANGHVH